MLARGRAVVRWIDKNLRQLTGMAKIAGYHCDHRVRQSATISIIPNDKRRLFLATAIDERKINNAHVATRH